MTLSSSLVVAALAAMVLAQSAGGSAPQSRPRARDLGLAPGAGQPGAQNAITDVPGVLVGHVTIARGEDVRTGVTAVRPHDGNLFRQKVPGAVFVGNAFGKLAGSTQVQELGTIETPIVLTNTLSVAAGIEGMVRWTIAQDGNRDVRSVNALVGETNDGGLNDIRGLHVTADDVVKAIESATGGAVAEGAVGAGTGTVAFGWKGGIGTSSRVVGGGRGVVPGLASLAEAAPQQQRGWTVGVLVQSNYGGRLTMGGVPVWRELTPGGRGRGGSDAAADAPARDADGSCMIVVATDAPLDARDLERLAARAIFALARTGSTYSNGSGDFAIAFSTAGINRIAGGQGPQPREFLTTDAVSGLFEAVLDATEEAVYNSLLQATDTTGNGRTVRAIPIDELRAVLKKYGR